MKHYDRELTEEATALLGHHRLRRVNLHEEPSETVHIMGLCEKHKDYDGAHVIGVLVQPEQCFPCWCEWEDKPQNQKGGL